MNNTKHWKETQLKNCSSDSSDSGTVDACHHVIRSVFFFGSLYLFYIYIMYIGLKVTQQVPLPASVEAFHGELKNVLPDGTTGSLQNWERPRTNGVLRSKYRLAQHQPGSDLRKTFSAPPETLEHRDLQCFVLPGQGWTPKGRFWACQVNCGKLKSHSGTAVLNAAFCSTPEGLEPDCCWNLQAYCWGGYLR